MVHSWNACRTVSNMFSRWRQLCVSIDMKRLLKRKIILYFLPRTPPPKLGGGFLTTFFLLPPLLLGLSLLVLSPVVPLAPLVALPPKPNTLLPVPPTRPTPKPLPVGACAPVVLLELLFDVEPLARARAASAILLCSFCLLSIFSGLGIAPDTGTRYWCRCASRCNCVQFKIKGC